MPKIGGSTISYLATRRENDPRAAFKRTGTDVSARSKKWLVGTALGLVLTSIVGVGLYFENAYSNTPKVEDPINRFLTSVESRNEQLGKFTFDPK